MRRVLDFGLPAMAFGLLIIGGVVGLAIAPPERDMGDVYRIIYVHVPAALGALIAYTTTLVASLVYLFKSSWAADAIAESSAEVGVVLNGMLLITGSIWGRPTWGVWWTWDPRLTTAAIMFFAFVGYLALRRFVDAPEKRATWASVVAIIVYVDIPIVWFSVRWWNSLHQLQSSPNTIPDPMMKLALRLNAFALLFFFLWFTRQRYRIARTRQRVELMEPPALAPAMGGTP